MTAKILQSMNSYSAIGEAWQERTEKFDATQKNRLIQWRTEAATVRLAHPTRLDRARSLGYKAKQGVIVVRQRMDRGGRMRPQIRKVRKTSHSRQTLVLSKNYQQIAEERVAMKFPNMEILNSYFVGKDGKHYWYEIILVDPENPTIESDKNLNWVANPANRRRVFRGLTSSGRKRRNLDKKGKGTEKNRPSLRAHNRTK
jgi:large subunit ribosomal protein L15e